MIIQPLTFAVVPGTAGRVGAATRLARDGVAAVGRPAAFAPGRHAFALAVGTTAGTPTLGLGFVSWTTAAGPLLAHVRIHAAAAARHLDGLTRSVVVAQLLHHAVGAAAGRGFAYCDVPVADRTGQQLFAAAGWVCVQPPMGAKTVRFVMFGKGNCAEETDEGDAGGRAAA